MATLVETPSWIGVYKLELEDKVEGGTPVFDVDGDPVSGWANAPLQHLTNRTAYLKAQIEALQTSKQDLIPSGTTSQFYRGDKQFASVTKSNVGLGNVDNTSDANKPISTATQNALNLKVNTSSVGANNGVASLDGTGKVPASQMPSTDSVSEGSTNKYFTNERAQTAIKADPAWKENDWDTAHGWGNHAVAGYEHAANKGQPNGYAPLNAAGKLPVDNVDGTWLGGLSCQGAWNPATNNPALPTPEESNRGWFYVANRNGTYNGQDYLSGDFVVSNGSAWQHVDKNLYAYSQLDLDDVTLRETVAQSLHRSPNAVTAMFVYDTSKDSDGGAWTEKCQHTSWYNEPINGKWLGAHASEASARAVGTTGDYFQLTTNGLFYRLNAGSGTTETFRGNKRDFPRLAAIVAERISSTVSSVVIYDLTESGRPMWMRFVASSTASKNIINNNSSGLISSLCASNGVLAASNTNAGVSLVAFTKDNGVFYYTSPGSSQYRGDISERNESAGTDSNPTIGSIANLVVNAVAMTILPGSPVDPVSGLTVPTIACLPGETRVKMADGSDKRIDEIVVGEFVKTLEGIHEVTNFFNQGIKETIELEFDNGAKLVCTPDHKIRTTTGWVEAINLTEEHDVVGL